jgi:hypothetical protein
MHMPLQATLVTRQGVLRIFLTTSAAIVGPVCSGYSIGYSSPATADLQRGNGGQRAILSSEAIAWFVVSALEFLEYAPVLTSRQH